MTTEYKDFTPVLKAVDGKGKGQAIIAQLNVVDADGDVTTSGAFGEQYAKILPAHDWSHPSIGHARLYESGNAILADFEINLEMQSGKVIYQSLKWDLEHPPSLQEWSYGFRVLEHDYGPFDGQQVRFLKKVKAIEISPVVVGAGVGTRTLALKSDKLGASVAPPPEARELKGPVVVPPHQTPVEVRLWNVALQDRRVMAEADPGYYQSLFALRDRTGKPGVKASWRGLHHHVDDEGHPGAASLRACLEGIAYANGRGGILLPEGERRGYYDHLAQHVKDAGREPPAFKGLHEIAAPLDYEVELGLWAMETLIERIASIRDIRALKGKGLSDERLAQLADMQLKVEQLCQIVRIKKLDVTFGPQLQHELEEKHKAMRAAVEAAEAAKADAQQQEILAAQTRFRSAERRVKEVLAKPAL